MSVMYDVDAIRAANPVEVILPRLTGQTPKTRGREIYIRCPFHHDGHPNLRINADKGLWCCDVCGFGGDVIAFVQRHEGRVQ